MSIDFQLDLSIHQGVGAIQSYHANSYMNWQFFRELPTQNECSARIRQLKKLKKLNVL